MEQAPPRQKVDLVLRAYEHFRETGELDPDHFHPDFVWDMSSFGGWLEQRTYPGVEGAMQFMTEWLDAWDDWEWEIRSIEEKGDKVVAVLHQAGRAKSTGIRVEMDFAQLFTIQGGRQQRMQMYDDADEARAAAGLTR